MVKSGQPVRRPSGAHQGGSEGGLGPNSEIGRKLREYYNELVSEEIPDRFSRLLRELEAAESPGNDEGDGGSKPGERA